MFKCVNVCICCYSYPYTLINESANDLNIDLEKISQWAYRWIMQLNPDPNKQANEVIFSRKSNSSNLTYPPPPLLNLTISTLLDVLVENI